VRRLVLIGGIATLALAASAYAAFYSQATTPSNSFTANSSFCVSPGTQTVSAEADTYVREDGATSNFGTVTTANVKSDSGKARRMLVRFTLPTVPHNCDVTAATLRLFQTASNTPHTINVYRADAAWSETVVTWNTRPGTAGTAVSGAAASGAVSWTVTAHVQAFYSGSNTGFYLLDAQEGAINGQQAYATRENASNHPALDVTFG
jgi:hypothetical protein